MKLQVGGDLEEALWFCTPILQIRKLKPEEGEMPYGLRHVSQKRDEDRGLWIANSTLFITAIFIEGRGVVFLLGRMYNFSILTPILIFH